ncbi:putative gastrointestinal growth factor xP4 [Xenia sp. Carnegie-2017]|uniref:putative gastrointestinal growth factor xP4 n=1 Tax=Xenia sp. Carnegie-2017 TaxID=2897299 RepID=UPI001F04F9A0|nr:putative gastrointestinal growth factor xP4 [Xenia sp. Carnegie-2017]
MVTVRRLSTPIGQKMKFTGTLCTKNVKHEGATCDNISAKIKCGQYGITEEQCLSNDCCWNQGESSEFGCYFRGHECSEVLEIERLHCGYPGITETQCKKKGCCWDKEKSGVPYCFYQSESCDVSKPVERVGCGKVGITESQCEAIGCCWDDHIEGVHNCYRRVRLPELA